MRMSGDGSAVAGQQRIQAAEPGGGEAMNQKERANLRG
jgi:hypothetical protein